MEDNNDIPLPDRRTVHHPSFFKRLIVNDVTEILSSQVNLVA